MASNNEKDIKNIIREDPDGLIARAHKFAQEAHKGQKRRSGEPYFSHLEASAQNLLDWELDDAAVAAGLLHDTVEDTDVKLTTIENEFGKDVAFLVDGVTKLGRIKYRGDEIKIKNFHKLIVAVSEDLRVIFVKLADRLHNMQTLDALPPSKQKRIALETDEIYASLADRLGMHNVSGELHDLAFPYLHPKEYKWLEESTVEQYEERTRYLKKFKPQVIKLLKENGIEPLDLDFRAKRLYSLYRKLMRNEMDIEKIYDLVAIRIILASTEECYATLGIIHKAWPPLPGRIKDYIAMPKPNGYRSLHTTIIGPDKRNVEFQIRTEEMHREAEYGIAAHLLYKKGTTGKQTKEELLWLKELRKWQDNLNKDSDPEEVMENMKVDFFKNRIYAITPKGEVIDLPAGATPIDFAYRIHTDIGNSCVSAKVNDRMVPLDHEIQSGDMVEILTQKNKKPSEDWLDIVKTSQAKDRIRDSLRKTKSLRSRTPTKTEIKILAKDRLGLMKDIASLITRSHVNIIQANVNTQEKMGYSSYRIICETADAKKISKIVMKLKKMGVREVSWKMI